MYILILVLAIVFIASCSTMKAKYATIYEAIYQNDVNAINYY